MSAEALFSLINPSTFPAWALLLFAPRWKWTLPFVRFVVIPALAVVYMGILLAKWGEGEGDFMSLAGVMAWFVVAGWAHYLAFDLIVGAWIVEDALKRGAPAWLRIAPLPLTLMFGPAGLLLYLAGRSVVPARGAPTSA
jgi:hypothetical protein